MDAEKRLTNTFLWKWNSGWPIELTTNSANAALSSAGAPSLNGETPAEMSAIVNVLKPNVGSTDSDVQYVNGLHGLSASDGSPTYMGAVSPWFFTHYGVNSYNKNVSTLHCRWTSWGHGCSMSNIVHLLRRIASVRHTLAKHYREP